MKRGWPANVQSHEATSHEPRQLRAEQRFGRLCAMNARALSHIGPRSDDIFNSSLSVVAMTW